MADEDYEEDNLNNDGGRSGSGGQKRKSGNPNKGENPNPLWQKKFGRTSRDNNIYNIPDIEENECGSSTGLYVISSDILIYISYITTTNRMVHTSIINKLQCMFNIHRCDWININNIFISNSNK